MTGTDRVCECCNDARDNPAASMQFVRACLWCSARRIQFIQRVLRIPREQKVNRCRAAITEAVQQGLDEAEVRSMAKEAAWAIQPKPEKGKK